MLEDGARIYVGDDITLEQWLEFLQTEPEGVLFENYMFPSDLIRDAFIQGIHGYDESLVRLILRQFLDFGPLLGDDVWQLKFLVERLKTEREKTVADIKKHPYYRRLLTCALSRRKIPVYGSILWILDLLPGFPRRALNVIEAFAMLHLCHLPDGRVHGLFDAEKIVRARYFGAQTDTSVLYSLTPTDFEHAVEAVYHEMGYSTKMTKQTHDGGRDIIAGKAQPGHKEHLVISCKRLRDNVEPPDYREIMFSVEKEGATKGIVVTTSDFSSEAYSEARQIPRMELIGQNNLQKMLNEHLGTNWSAHLDDYIRESKVRHPKEKRV